MSTEGLGEAWDIVRYEDFDPDNPNAIWFIRDGEDYPRLYWQVYKVDNFDSGLSLIDLSLIHISEPTRPY